MEKVTNMFPPKFGNIAYVPHYVRNITSPVPHLYLLEERRDAARQHDASIDLQMSNFCANIFEGCDDQQTQLNMLNNEIDGHITRNKRIEDELDKQRDAVQQQEVQISDLQDHLREAISQHSEAQQELSEGRARTQQLEQQLQEQAETEIQLNQKKRKLVVDQQTLDRREVYLGEWSRELDDDDQQLNIDIADLGRRQAMFETKEAHFDREKAGWNTVIPGTPEHTEAREPISLPENAFARRILTDED